MFTRLWRCAAGASTPRIAGVAAGTAHRQAATTFVSRASLAVVVAGAGAACVVQCCGVNPSEFMTHTSEMIHPLITDEQWHQFDREGFVVLSKDQVFASDEEFQRLRQHMDDIMMGRADVPYDKMMMQLDSATGRYEDSGAQTLGFKKPTLAYRKIQNLDLSPVVMEYLRKPIMRSACARIYGAETPIASYRTMFFNKPANQGTALPWHQDRWKHLDRDPILNVYLALDDATPANGCVQFIPRSHVRGIINPDHHSAFLTEEQVKKECRDDDPMNPINDMQLKAGQVVLMHNWIIHRSGINKTSKPRRALSVSFMDARSRLNTPELRKYVGGKLATTGYPEGADEFPCVFDGE